MPAFSESSAIDAELEAAGFSNDQLEAVKFGWYLAICDSLSEAMEKFMPDVEDWERIGCDSQPATFADAQRFIESYR